MIKNIILDVGKVLVAWEPEDAMKQLGFDDKTVKAVADARSILRPGLRQTVVSGQMNRFFRHFMRRHRNIKKRSICSGIIWNWQSHSFPIRKNGFPI